MVLSLRQRIASNTKALFIAGKYNIPEVLNLKIHGSNPGQPKYLIITCENVSGLITGGKNLKEAFSMINDAVLTYYDVPNAEFDGNILSDDLWIELSNFIE